MEEALIKRIMPNSLEAEQSVVGSMIMSKDAIVTASEMLLKEDFYHQQYGIIFETMVELFTEGQPVDLVTLQNRLKEKDVPQEIQSLDFVRTLVTSVPTSANIKYYANIVKEKALLRELIRTTEGIENAAYAQKDPVEDILADIRVGMNKGNPDAKFVEIPDRLDALHYAVDHAQEGDLIAVIGKGHETYRDREGVKTPFLERELLEEYAQQIGLE